MILQATGYRSQTSNIISVTKHDLAYRLFSLLQHPIPIQQFNIQQIGLDYQAEDLQKVPH